MYGAQVRLEARKRHAAGASISAIARDCGASRASVRSWLRSDPEERFRRTCFVCGDAPCPQPATYAYLLGQYLGDGYLVTRAKVPRLRIFCCSLYSEIEAEVDAALAAVSGNSVTVVHKQGCSERVAYWKHWPCVFPQHGVGPKHKRRIELASWQQSLVRGHPWPLIRGLIHSDGCRAVNRVVTRGRTYSYPRYFFGTESTDILQIMGDALDRVGVAWRYNRPNSISVARRDAVALMDEHVGPKS